MSDYFDPKNEELLKDFFAEAEAQIGVLEQNLLVLDNDPNNKDAVDELFRAAHTLKGGSATVQMDEISKFTHLIEDVLEEVRSANKKITEQVIDSLLSAVDVLKDMVDKRAHGEVFEEDIKHLTTVLENLIAVPQNQPKKSHVERKVQKTVDSTESKEEGGLTEYELLEFQQNSSPDENIYKIQVEFDENNPMNTVGGIQVYAILKNLGKILKTIPEFELLYADNFFPEITYYIATKETPTAIRDQCKITDVTTDVSVYTIKGQIQGTEQGTSVKKSIQAEIEAADHDLEERDFKKVPHKLVGSVLRVDSKRIDTLLNLVSEIVIMKSAVNQINLQFGSHYLEFQNIQAQFQERIKELFDRLPDYMEEIQKGTSLKAIKKNILTEFGDLLSMHGHFDSLYKDSLAKFRGTAQSLGRITSSLQEGVMQIRMVPISHIFSRFPRLVRDLSKSLKKKINLIIEGEQTELDKSIIEDLLDPLIHCVRNSIDHGIEEPKEREKLGKEKEGTIVLRASNEGNMVVIEIEDDGIGIDVGAIRKKAIDTGLIHPDKSLSDIEAYNLIFKPGFSTAKRVTDVSGRGVGLDVVKQQIEKMNGDVSIWSSFNQGTKFTIRIPLTLAIVQGLLVRVGKEIYAIPITSVFETLRITGKDIKRIDNYEVFNLREDVISLIRLNKIFNIPVDETREYNYVVVVGSGEKKVGLFVDVLIGEEDVVIKPLKDRFTKSPGIAGATILGDGTVSLILDVNELLNLGLEMEIDERKKREGIIS
ncbi:MAG: chemotaxis protein CheA [Spirochaetales bacterium]|nr:chemotaxis protein CheA [Spirochaetales bacterium]